MARRLLSLFCFATLALAFAGNASAAPISMDPDPLTVGSVFGIGGDFTITFAGGDTSDNILNFSAAGSGGFGPGDQIPSAALVALVFDAVTIVGAGDAIGDPFDPNNVVNGLVIPGTGVAAALLLDPFAPSSEDFFLELDAAADFFAGVTATLYNIEIDGVDSVDSLLALLDNDDLLGLLEDSIVSQTTNFSAEPIPEPTAALAFGVGLLITGGAVRRRR